MSDSKWQGCEVCSETGEHTCPYCDEVYCDDHWPEHAAVCSPDEDDCTGEDSYEYAV